MHKNDNDIHTIKWYVCHFFMASGLFVPERHKVAEMAVAPLRKRSEMRNSMNKDSIKEFGTVELKNNEKGYNIHLLSVIGEVEGHEMLPSTTKTTKYEHILPELVMVEDSTEYDAMLMLLNTSGGDVESGLAIAEMIASMTKPVVSLVLGGSHSIGVPLCVAADYSFIVPTGTMVIHPVRLTGTVIGAQKTYDYFKIMQNRIIDFTVQHSNITKEKIEEMMMSSEMFSKDLGTILVGKEAVECGLVNAVGGINDALQYLYGMIDVRKK